MKIVNRKVWSVIVCGVTFAIAGTLHAQTQYFDLNGDGIDETIISEPLGEGNSEALGVGGQVTIIWGHTGNQMVKFVSEIPNDEFGFAVTVVPDVTGDDYIDLVIGAPGSNKVYVYTGPWMTAIDVTVNATRATTILEGSPEVTRFGLDVAPLFDGNNDGVADIQIICEFIGVNGDLRNRIYLYSVYLGVPIAQIDPVDYLPQCPKFIGDLNGDAQATIDEFDLIINNYGLTSAKRKQGDLTGDGIVDIDDVAESILNIDTIGYQLTSPPVEGCPSGQSSGELWITVGDQGVGCYTPLMSAVRHILFDIGSGSIEFPPIDPTTPPLLEPDTTACDDWVGCIGTPEFDAALEAMLSCTSTTSIDIAVICGECGEGFTPHGQTGPNCWKGVPYSYPSATGPIIRWTIVVCSDAPQYHPEFGTVCQLLAHEITHLSQFCLAGYFETGMLCEDYEDLFLKNKLNSLCSEMEALLAQGFCTNQTDPLDDGQCCDFYCDNYQNWQLSKDECKSCCEARYRECCSNGLWTCDTGCEAYEVQP